MSDHNEDDDMNPRLLRRRANFKKGISGDDARRRREEGTNEIRKSKKEQFLNKRRREVERRTNYKQMDSEIREKLDNIDLLVMGVESNDPTQQLESVQQFRRLLSIEKHPPIDQVIKSGVVPHLVDLLHHTKNVKLQFECAWALTNIASGTGEQTREVVDEGAVDAFIPLLESKSEDVKEQAIWALGNIAGDSWQCRDFVLGKGALTYLLDNLADTDNQRPSLTRNATWTLSNFCRGKPQPNFEIVSQALPTLFQLIWNEDEEVIADALWALSYLSDGPNDKIQAVLDANVGSRVVDMLSHRNASIQTPALRTIGNIVTGDDTQTQEVLLHGALDGLAHLMMSGRKGIKKEACWAVSNITAGNKNQIQMVLDSDLVPLLIDVLNKAEFDVRKEAAWAISNAASGGTPEQIKRLVEYDVIPPMINLLNVHDARIITVALEGLEKILFVGKTEAMEHGGPNEYALIIEDCEGDDVIYNLQEHENNDIYEKAMKIMEAYFDAVDAGDENVLPEQDDRGFAFGGGGYNDPADDYDL
eukprot:TRINITY_DN3664_c0_g1_i3.p1 TRINITY_DN3664_c0_g1~~TRINITY_DN3664_c0_g1_i3.p1  ORF type:complete len:549 (+),score=220.19 TRINITY_DN3664_c0_g1_i3:52-1647(+)